MNAASGDDPARERARAARRRRLRTHALGLTHDDARLCDAVDHAKTCLADIDSSAHGAAGSLAAFGTLAIGEYGQARAAIDAMFADSRSGGDVDGDGSDGQRAAPDAHETASNALRTAADAASGREPAADPLVHACLAGRFHAWTGDAHAAASWLGPAVRVVERVESDVTPLIARDLLALAEALGDVAAATRLRPRMRGADPDRSADAALLGAADGERTGTTSHAAGPEAPQMTTILENLLAGRTDAGVAGWTALATDAGATDALWLPHLLAVGILGIDPDAARGRLRLRLHAPRAWTAWGATNIRVGDARLEVRVSRDADHLEISVEQSEGPLPLTLILEPILHATIAATRVDGTPADLAIRSRADAMVAPVQLVLDAPRTLALDLGPSLTG